MKIAELRFSVLAFALAVGIGSGACRDSTPPAFDDTVDTEGTGGRPATGGRKGSSGAGGAAAAPAPGKTGGVGVADAAPDLGASDVVGVGPASDAVGVVDVIAPVDVSGLVDVMPIVDATPVVPDAAAVGLAACYPDPKVIAICHQLESACQNCPGGALGKVSVACFKAVEKANDVACAKFAVDNKCLVDDVAGKGNVCGSLNCGIGGGPPVAAGCNKAACAKAQGEGDSAKCQPLLAACPCK